jgi:hypothetical protein
LGSRQLGEEIGVEIGGWQHRKRSTRTTDEAKARRALARWKAEVLGGTWLPDADRTTFADLAAMLRHDYVANGRRSLNRIENALAHLTPAFGHLRARARSPPTASRPT